MRPNAGSPARYGRVNTFGIFAAYSNDSSHMLLGSAERRKLLEFGGSYSRRILMNRIVDWQYDLEVLPVALESDPVMHEHYVYTSDMNPADVSSEDDTVETEGACYPSSGSGDIPGFFSYSYANTCGRRWTIGEAMSPVGFQWNFLTADRVQPLLEGHGGYMYSTQPIPEDGAGNFNFTFDLGAGVEWFRTRTRSIRLEYRYHHISNHNTAELNPGIDNGLAQVTYCFGR